MADVCATDSLPDPVSDTRFRNALEDDPLSSSGYGGGIEADTEWVDINFSQWRDDLTDEQIDVLAGYTDSLYSDVNSSLRAGETAAGSEFAPSIAVIDSALASSPGMPEDMILYRGVDGVSAKLFADAPSGTMFQDLGYMSTTRSRTMAGKFIEEDDQGMILRIFVPEGHGGIPVMKGFAAEEEEFEMILSRGTQFRIRGVQGNTIEVEVIR